MHLHSCRFWHCDVKLNAEFHFSFIFLSCTLRSVTPQCHSWLNFWNFLSTVSCAIAPSEECLLNLNSSSRKFERRWLTSSFRNFRYCSAMDFLNTSNWFYLSWIHLEFVCNVVLRFESYAPEQTHFFRYTIPLKDQSGEIFAFWFYITHLL